MIKKKDMLLTILGFTVLLAIWEIISKSGFFNQNLFPGPSIVFNSFIESIISGELAKDLKASAIRVVTGFFVGSMLGIILGFFTGRANFFRLTIGQIAHFLKNIPAIAFVPLAVVWFGIGEISKVFLIAWSTIFPVWVNTHHGALQVEKHYLWIIRSLGANRLQVLKEVIFPNAMPYILSGLRIGIAMSFIALVASELAGAFSGIGYRISVSHLIFRVDKMLSGIVTLGFLGLFADKIYLFIVKKTFPWVLIK